MSAVPLKLPAEAAAQLQGLAQLEAGTTRAT
jgi:hypothetical protein